MRLKGGVVDALPEPGVSVAPGPLSQTNRKTQHRCVGINREETTSNGTGPGPFAGGLGKPALGRLRV
jgi:hypothetical protein